MKHIKKLIIYKTFNFEGEDIQVPEFIGHKYKPIRFLPLSVLNDLKEHKRLRVFYHKGFECATCDKVGKYLIECIDRGGGVHIDLYTENFEMMTIDHIKPKSKGGTDDIENLQPMCQKCNEHKKNKYDEDEIK